MNNNGVIAGVAVERAHYSFDLLFEYLAPDFMTHEVQTGKRVIVPFGNGSKKCVGLIMSLREGEYDPKKIKKIISVLDEKPVFGEESLGLIRWLKENTFCTYYDAVKTMLPTGLGINITEQFKVNTIAKTVLSEEEKPVYDALLSAKSPKETDEIIKQLICVNKKVFDSLSAKNIIREIHEAKTKFGGETVSMFSLPSDFSEEIFIDTPLTPKQKKVVNMLSEYGSASAKEICYACNVTPAVIKNLSKKGILEETENIVSHSITKDNTAVGSPSDIVFSSEQQRIFDGLLDLLYEDKPRCALLRGITGSGKTSVFIKLIDEALNAGKTAVMLVPEIALTPQMTGNFIRLFGNKVAIIHSGLSLGQRADEYRRIENGEAAIVIGTRSAVFAPLKNIGIIVIDEEGEHSYKSDRSPRYHARNVAKQRAFYHNALLLLASATPSLESMYYAKTGRYALFELDKRYKKAVLPDVYTVDMKIEAETGNRSNFSAVLIDELKYNLEKGEQSLVLLNRRGYHTYANCISCGAVVGCPNCGVALTYHKANDTMQCHYCGFVKTISGKCEECGSKFIYQSGTGTQRIEDELKKYFPNARVLRMDADTTMTKNAFEKNFTRFRNKEYDIMVGTQMIAKGLDFENVTLVGVLLIDKMLYAGDYVGYERVFSLITQVVGRSGRGEKKGRAYLQTFTPEHYVLELAASQNYNEFFEQELEVRKALIFPPVCDLFLIGFSAVLEHKAGMAAEKFVQIFAEHIKIFGVKTPFRVLGPTKSVLERINGKYRYKVIVKTKNNAEIRKIMSEALKNAYNDNTFKDVSFYIDINGEIP